MKLLLYILIFSTLNASIFTLGSDNKKHSNIAEEFRQNVNDANSIIWRGEYDKIAPYKSNIVSIMKKVENLDISKENKDRVKNDLQTYADLVNVIADSLQKEAPTLNSHYVETIDKLEIFNKKISNIGFYTLITHWRELSSIKNDFVKKPSPTLEKRFENVWNEMTITITELYLDDEVEKFLFNYMNHYKLYFKEINQAYKRANYDNINKLKPLSYKIKAELEIL